MKSDAQPNFVSVPTWTAEREASARRTHRLSPSKRTFSWLALAGVGWARLHFWLQLAVLSPRGVDRDICKPLERKYPGWDSNPHEPYGSQDFKSCPGEREI